MYIPNHFAAPDLAAVHELLGARTAADLVTWSGTGMVASTVPLIFDPATGPHGVLIGHLARNNEQWRHGTDQHSTNQHGSDRVEAMVIFRGADAYVSPSSYATKREHGRVVPTWNYLTAHVYGLLTAHDDPAWTERAVRRLTDRHEGARDAPWSVDDAPYAFVEGQLRAIVGIELAITRIEAKWKLSQNRSVEDITGVRDDLRERDTDKTREVAGAMEERLSRAANSVDQR